MAEEDWSEAKAWMRATRERIGMTQHDVAVGGYISTVAGFLASGLGVAYNPLRKN